MSQGDRRRAKNPEDAVPSRYRVRFRRFLPDVVRLRADVEWGVTLTKDGPGLPADRGSTERVPGVTHDQADVAGVGLECGGYSGRG